MTETTAPLKPGQLVRFARWKALGWTAEPKPRRVLDVRQAVDSDEQEITFTGLTWGPGKHFEPVVDEEPVVLAVAPANVQDEDLMAVEERDIFVHDSKAYEAVFWGSDCDACGGNTTPDSGICDSCGNSETHHLFRLVRTVEADPS